VGEAGADHVDLRLGILVGTLRRPLRLGEEVFQVLDVGEEELELDRLHVGHRIDFSRDVDDVGILEAADDLQDRVHLADVGEELVAQALTLARPLHDSGDVHQLERRRDHLLRGNEPGDPLQAVVGHAHHPLVGLDRAEGIVGALRRLRLREGVEERALADVRQSDDACFHGGSGRDGSRGGIIAGVVRVHRHGRGPGRGFWPARRPRPDRVQGRA